MKGIDILNKIESMEQELADLKIAVSSNNLKQDKICPVFLERPEIGENYFCITDSCIIEGIEWVNHSVDHQKYDTGNCFKTESDVRKYPINPGIQKYRQIIHRDYGGEPTDEDWKDGNVSKYFISYNVSGDYFDNQNRTLTLKSPGKVYSLKNPDINKVVDEMRDLMQWLK